MISLLVALVDLIRRRQDKQRTTLIEPSYCRQIADFVSKAIELELDLVIDYDELNELVYRASDETGELLVCMYIGETPRFFVELLEVTVEVSYDTALTNLVKCAKTFNEVDFSEFNSDITSEELRVSN
ncbi:MAG: hypothetical protein AB4372_01510 [Xenococcus sp. (in: cyanobacteria)]